MLPKEAKASGGTVDVAAAAWPIHFQHFFTRERGYKYIRSWELTQAKGSARFG